MFGLPCANETADHVRVNTESWRLVPLFCRLQLLQLLLQELGFELVVSVLLPLRAPGLGVRSALALVVQLLVQLSDILRGDDTFTPESMRSDTCSESIRTMNYLILT